MPAALAGIHLIRREPLAVLTWGLSYMGLYILPLLLMIWVILSIDSASNGSEPGEAFIAPFFALFAIFPVIVIAAVALMLVIHNAVWRAVLFPERRAYAYMRLGVEEGRTFLVALVLVALFYVAAMIFMLVVMMPAMVWWAYSFERQAQENSVNTLSAFVNLLPVLVGQLLVYAALAWPFARLALGMPMSLAEGRLRIFDGWQLSKGYGWALWRMTLTVWIGLVLAEIVLFALLGLLGYGLFGRFFAGPDFFYQGGFTVRMTVFGGVAVASMFAFACIAFPVIAAPIARAYQLLAARQESEGDRALR